MNHCAACSTPLSPREGTEEYRGTLATGRDTITGKVIGPTVDVTVFICVACAENLKRDTYTRTLGISVCGRVKHLRPRSK